MKHVVVIGGGLSGLTTSVYLSEKNIKITLLEASPKLGGRTYSIFNEDMNCFHDNGQHIMMGCYDETLAFLKKIGTYQNLYLQERLDIPFVSQGGEIFRLKAGKNPYPFDLLWALLNYRAVSFKSRLKVIDFFLDLMCCFAEDLADINVKQWLDCKKQSDESVKRLWEILTVGTMNTSLEKASAEIFNEVLKEIFLNGKFASKIVIPDLSLSDLFVSPCKKVIEKNGEVLLAEKLEELSVLQNRICSLKSNKRIIEEFDAVVLAVPPYALRKLKFICDVGSPPVYLMPEILESFKYAPILNIHMWLDKNPFVEKFYGLLESKIHWVFNHGDHISITTSGADDYLDLSSEKIFLEFCSELERYFPIFNPRFVKSFSVIKEKRATFIPSIETQKARKKFSSNYSNLFFTGDWIDNGLPSTIESAVLNGRLAAKSVMNFLFN